MALTREIRASGAAVTQVVHEHKRLGRGIELAALAEQLKAGDIGLEFLTGELQGSHDPSGVAFTVLAAVSGLKREYIRDRTLEVGGAVELLADLSVHCGMRVTIVRVEAREQAEPVLGGLQGAADSTSSPYLFRPGVRSSPDVISCTRRRSRARRAGSVRTHFKGRAGAGIS